MTWSKDLLNLYFTLSKVNTCITIISKHCALQASKSKDQCSSLLISSKCLFKDWNIDHSSYELKLYRTNPTTKKVCWNSPSGNLMECQVEQFSNLYWSLVQNVYFNCEITIKICFQFFISVFPMAHSEKDSKNIRIYHKISWKDSITRALAQTFKCDMNSASMVELLPPPSNFHRNKMNKARLLKGNKKWFQS